MRLAGLCFTWAFIAISSTVYAREARPRKELPAKGPRRSSETAPVAQPPSTPRPTIGQSEMARKTRKFVVHAEIGLIDVLRSGFGVNAGLIKDSRNLYEADLFRASFEFLGYKSSTTTYIARYKHFFGNSFFMHGGGGLRTDEASNPAVFFFSDGDYSSQFSATSIVAEIDIGNRWQMDSGLSIGCDWVGLTLPLTKISSSESFGSSLSEDQKASERSSFDSRVKNSSLNLVRFHLGIAF